MPAAFPDLKDFTKHEAVAPARPMVPLSEAEAMAARARAEAFAEGASEGQSRALEEADKTLAAQTLALTRQMTERVEALSAQEDAVLDRLEIHATRLVLAVVQRLASGVAEAEAEKAARTVAARVISQLRRRSHLHVTTAPEISETIERLFADAAAPLADPPTITVRPDPDLSKTSFKAEWQTGSMTYDLAPATAAVDQIIEEAKAALDHHDPDKETSHDG